MKKTFITLFIMALASMLIAQTSNTFPSSGASAINRSSNFYSLLHIASSYSKTDVGNRYLFYQSTSDVNNPFGMITYVRGGASLANRTVVMETADYNIANGGNIAFQPISGNVGIGTADPTYGKLQIEYNADNNIFLGTTVAGNSRFALGTDASANVYMRTGNNVDLRMGVGANDQLVLKYGGNFGIGTTNPTSKLSITDGVAPYAAAEGVFVDIKRNVTNGNNTTSAVGIRFGNNSNAFMVYYGGTTDRLRFIDGGNVEVLSLLNGGNVGIGTTSPTEKLSVKGNIRAQKVIVSQNGWSDYVFNDDYKLRSLDKVEQFIKANKHLPEIPSAEEVEEKGISVAMARLCC